jgi:hypothetical protein
VKAGEVPREHLTCRFCDLISRSGAGGVPGDLAVGRAGPYLIAEAPAQFTGKPLLGYQLGQVAPHNADAKVVAHARTIATLRTGTRTITAADPLPGHLPGALDRIYGTQVRTKLAQLG